MHIIDFMVEETEVGRMAFMYGKIQITGKIEVMTGMHIGGSAAFAAIGAVDANVIRDAVSRLPIIPGSSLKGKLRTLLAKQYNQSFAIACEKDAECIQKLFGNSKSECMKNGRLIFSDMLLTNSEELRNGGLQNITEIKSENSINRATAVANPRQIERVVRGSEFSLDLIYNAEKEEEIESDIKVLADGLKLLQFDYLGGSGSRGYGKVRFHDLLAKTVIGKVREDILVSCNEMLKEVYA